MWMNGSRSATSTPANARRTGKPSPSNPFGAVVTERTGRGLTAVVGTVREGTVAVSAVTAGMTIEYTTEIVAIATISRDGLGPVAT